MSDRPRDHVIVGFEEDRLVARARLRGRFRLLDDLLVRVWVGLLPASLRRDVLELAPLEGTIERGREIASDGRLFGDDECLGHENTIATPSRPPLPAARRRSEERRVGTEWRGRG